MFQGYKIIQSNDISQFHEFEKTIPLTLKERFLLPILHPVTLPFEPWVKTRQEIKSERYFMYMGDKIITHPGNYMFLRQKFEIPENYNWNIGCEGNL